MPQIRDHWVQEWGAEKAWDATWQEGYRDDIIRDAQHLGTNSLGYHCETPIVMDDPLGRFMPYIRQYHPIPFSSCRKPGPEVYADIFEPAFAEHCDQLAQELIKPFADDPMVIGIAMADVPTMTDSESNSPWSGGPTWPKVLRNRAADAAGKQAYVAMMKERHADIATFNAAYGTDFDSWDALAAATDWRPDTDMKNKTELADNMAFMRACVEQYYKAAHAAIRRYDKNHLFLGDKWQANGDSYHNTIDVIAPYVDVAYFQCYGEYDYMKPRMDEWSRLSGLPLLNGDSSFGAPREHVPRPGGTVMPTEADRVAATLEYAEKCFARPDFVGWHLCGILEMWDTMPGQQRRQKIGLKSPFGEWRPEITEAVQSISARLYDIATGADSQVDLDQYGGWTGKTFDATGFFRTEHDGARWWLVTPEGNAFLVLGANHYHAHLFDQEACNRDHWVEAFGGTEFHSPEWRQGFRDEAVAQCAHFGFNTLGIHNDDYLNQPPLGPFLPYVRRYEPVVLSHYRNPKAENYVDVFAPEFEAHCDAVAKRQAAPYADDPYVIGYSMSDIPVITDELAKWKKGTAWPRVLRNLPGDAPGKQAYVETVRSHYPDVAAFNAAYGTQFVTWDELAQATDWRADAPAQNDAERQDNAAFLARCLDRYYTVAKTALLRHDPNHLFLGDKLPAWGTTLDDVLETTSRHTDIVNLGLNMKWGDGKRILDRWAPVVNQPFFDADSTFAPPPSENVPNPMGTPTKSAEERAALMREKGEGILSHPNAVGWAICGVIEVWKQTMPGMQHSGIMDPEGNSYPEMEAAIQDLSARMYRIAEEQP